MENDLISISKDKKYNVIYADPAWQYGSKELYGDKTKGSDKRENRFRTIERIYTTMTIEDIKQLPVKEITDKNCACFMWVTDSHLKEGIEVMEAWDDYSFDGDLLGLFNSYLNRFYDICDTEIKQDQKFCWIQL